jgi:hypothetical protein
MLRPILTLGQVISSIYAHPRTSHDDGLAALLHLRGPNNLRNLSLFRNICARRLVRDLDERFDSSTSLSIDVLSLGGSLSVAPFWHLLSRVSTLCRNIRLLGSQAPLISQHELERAIEDATTLDLEFLHWKSTLPLERNYSTRATTNSSEGEPLVYPAQIHVFIDIQHGAMWIAYWCARLQLLSAIRWGQNFLSSALDQQVPDDLRRNSFTRALDVVDEICGSIPYMLGDIGPTWEIQLGSSGKAIGAFFATQALHMANSMECLSLSQSRWIQERLVYIGHARGIKAALESRRSWSQEQRERV